MAEPTCAVDGCDRSGKLKRGWCEKHYQRWRAHGHVGDDLPRTCADCPATFLPANANQRICQACRVTRKRNRDRSRPNSGHQVVGYKDCEWCGHAFEVRTDSPQARGCSQSCGNRLARSVGRTSPIKWKQCSVCNQWHTHKAAHDCWYVEPTPIAFCMFCDTVIKNPRSNTRYCSTQCKDLTHKGNARPIFVKDCAWCSTTFVSRVEHGAVCSKLCRKQQHRARTRFVVPDPIRYSIYERDGWRCQLCRKKVAKTLSHNAKWGPSLDHITPRSQGGPDTPDNLQLAHRYCNSVKCDGVWEQGEQLSILAAA